MIINLSKLITKISKKIEIDNSVELNKEYLKNTDIRDISTIKVKGEIVPFENQYELNLNIKCTLTLICSISLKDVEYNIDIDVNEVIGDDLESLDIEENNKIINNTIDLIPIIWQNIILEVPLKVISPEISPENISGDGWKFITDEEALDKEIDPRLEQLKKFLD